MCSGCDVAVGTGLFYLLRLRAAYGGVFFRTSHEQHAPVDAAYKDIAPPRNLEEEFGAWWVSVSVKHRALHFMCPTVDWADIPVDLVRNPLQPKEVMWRGGARRAHFLLDMSLSLRLLL